MPSTIDANEFVKVFKSFSRSAIITCWYRSSGAILSFELDPELRRIRVGRAISPVCQWLKHRMKPLFHLIGLCSVSNRWLFTLTRSHVAVFANRNKVERVARKKRVA